MTASRATARKASKHDRDPGNWPRMESARLCRRPPVHDGADTWASIRAALKTGTTAATASAEALVQGGPPKNPARAWLGERPGLWRAGPLP
eukprot:CAMPEP_0204526476 /NCGR_PEP_ID=MMETSP0661-20131031/8466_1 /ASSEMBLY_ACC=CAM_ASM_000606 /TAXON_ID=109239 /ORGANISM="Alexandrium margalefi, Strain AMGDE01CS-322" /LENGTH=90 /DNA_ID=CAMNT_0051532325 /DNA_START=135 /DNA_END=405 /DNA_ORIENTATION=-